MRKECSPGSFVANKVVRTLPGIFIRLHLFFVNEQVLLAVVLTPLDFLDVLVPYEPTNCFKRWSENSPCSVDLSAVFGGSTVKLVSGLPVLFLAFFTTIVRWGVVIVAIYAFGATCTAVFRCSASVSADSATSLGMWRCEVIRGWSGVAIGGGGVVVLWCRD